MNVKEKRKRFCICLNKGEMKHLSTLANEAKLPVSNYIRARVIYGNAHYEIRKKVESGVRF